MWWLWPSLRKQSTPRLSAREAPVPLNSRRGREAVRKKGETGETRKARYSVRACLLRVQTIPVCSLELNPSFA